MARDTPYHHDRWIGDIACHLPLRIQASLCTIASERLRRHSMTAMIAIARCMWHMCRIEDERINRITGVRALGAAHHAVQPTVQMALGAE